MADRLHRGAPGLILLWMPAGLAWASYGQMKLDLTPLLVLVAAALGLMTGLADVVLQKHRGAATLWLGGVLVFAACMAGLGSVVDAGVLMILAVMLGFSAAAMLLPGILHLFPLRAWQRMVLLLGTSLGCFLFARQQPPGGDDLWSLAAFLLPWGLLTGLAGERPRAASARSAQGSGSARGPLPRLPGREFAVWIAALGHSLLPALRRIGAALARVGPVGQIALLSLATYLAGAVLISLAVEPVDGVLLALAGVLTLGGEPPPFDPVGGLAYWQTFGMLPSALGGALLWLWLWLRRNWRTWDSA